MDLRRPISYRDFALNTIVRSPGEPQVGCMVERVDFSSVGADGYTEKRSQGDGYDASDIYLGKRIVQMSGTIYGETLADLHDRLQNLRSTLLPTASFTDEPGAYGYVPLSYEEATGNTADWPTGYRTLYVRARPLSAPSFQVVRDAVGGAADRGGGIPWSAVWDCIDPRCYVSPDVFLDFADNSHANPSSPSPDQFVNRGDYPTPINILLVVATQAKPGFFTFVTGGSTMKITIPQSANTQTIRYNGRLKVLTIEELGLEVLRMDCLTFTTETTHPLIVPTPLPGQDYTWTTVWSGGGSTYMTIPLAAGSRIFYSEAFG